MQIGKKLKEIRKAKKMSLSELAQKSGVQIATISRIEHMKMTGTLESHMQLAKALEINITQLYNDIIKEDSKIEIQTKKAPGDVFVHSPKSSYEILTGHVLKKKMMPILLRIEPGGQTNSEENSAGSEKFIYVLEGSVEVYIEEDTYSLSKSNSLYFDGSLRHHFVNKGKSILRLVCVTTPVAL